MTMWYWTGFADGFLVAGLVSAIGILGVTLKLLLEK